MEIEVVDFLTWMLKDCGIDPVCEINRKEWLSVYGFHQEHVEDDSIYILEFALCLNYSLPF